MGHFTGQRAWMSIEDNVNKQSGVIVGEYCNELIGASLSWGEPYSEPHHRRSTVKSVFLLASWLASVIPYMDDSGLHKYKLKHINGSVIPFKCQP